MRPIPIINRKHVLSISNLSRNRLVGNKKHNRRVVMSILNVDADCYQEDKKRQGEHQEEWLKTGYAPLMMSVNGPCIYHWDGIYHTYLIVGTPGLGACAPGNQLFIGHATTTDFLRWETHEPALYIDTRGWDSGHVWNPFILEKDNRFWMLYTGAPVDNTQRIGIAVSDDLENWERVFDHPIIRPEEYGWAYCPTEQGAGCRDPYVIQQGDEYWMYYTATTKEGYGCVARAVSKDLLEWQDKGLFYQKDTVIKCEDPVIIQTDNDRILLVFNSYLDPANWKGYGLLSVVCDNLEESGNKDPKPVGSGDSCYAMDLINRRDNEWLVSYVHPGEHGARMFIGVLDASGEIPNLEQASQADRIAPFLQR